MFKKSQNQQKIAVKKCFLQGFSLLELLVVIGLLGIVATAATTLLIDSGEEKRKDATEKNWDAIRKAIIGDSTLNLNGSPYLSGYVADMGRLPNNIKELMSLEAGLDLDGDDIADITLPQQPEWQAIDLNTVDGASGVKGNIYGGWKGPYLYNSGSRYFRDGWTNESKPTAGTINSTRNIPVVLALAASDQWIAEDKLNFGWNVSHSPTLSPTDTECGLLICEDMVVQSLGDGNHFTDTLITIETYDYEQNFPAASSTNIVSKNEWLIPHGNIVFDVVFNTAVSQTGLDLRIFNFEDDGIEDGSGAPANAAKDSVAMRSSNPQTVDSTAAVPDYLFTSGTAITSVQRPVTTGSSLSPSVVILPIGRYAAVVMCTNNNGASPTATVVDDVVFDGDCASDNTKAPYFFTILPNTRQVTIPWNIP